MVRFALLVSSVCSVFVLSFVLTRWFGPLNCINSTVIGKVVINSEATAVQSCDPVSRLTDPAPPALVGDTWLLQRIKGLEIVAPFLDLTEGPLTVLIRTDAQSEIAIHPGWVRISEDLLDEPGVFEKAVLSAKLQSDNLLTSEIIAEFLWQEFLVRAPIATPKPWAATLQSITAYCRGENVLMIHRGYCEAQNSLSDSFIADDEDAPVAWSLKPVYVQILRGLYRSGSMTEKRDLLHNLIFLGEMDDSFIEIGFRRSAVLTQDTSFVRMMSDWVMPLMMPEKVVASVISYFQVKTNPTEGLHLTVARSSREIFPTQFAESSPSRGTVIVQRGTHQFLYPSDVGFKESRANVVRDLGLRAAAYVACEMPGPRTILDYDGVAERVTFIKYCKAEDVDWRELAAQGLTKYLKSHPAVQFVEFNVSAVKLAQRVRGPMPARVAEAPDLSSWQRWLMWQKIVKDEEPSVQRPLSAIDGVSRFRFF